MIRLGWVLLLKVHFNTHNTCVQYRVVRYSIFMEDYALKSVWFGLIAEPLTIYPGRPLLQDI